MSTSMSPSAGNGDERGPGRWSDRLARLVSMAQSLVATRLAIFEEELGVKTRLFGKGVVVAGIAAAFGFGAMLLFAALLAAVLAQLFGNAALGILGAGVLYAAGAAAAGWFAWKAFSEVRPSDFPATSRELSRDAEAIRAALARDPDPEEGPDPGFDPEDDDRESEGDVRDLEARLRAGAE
jgi:uncharacterized membrane protein YqjE